MYLLLVLGLLGPTLQPSPIEHVPVSSPPDSLLVSVSVDRMNIFHLGLDNPITVAACGLDAQRLKVSSEGCIVRHVEGPHYMVRCNKPGRTILLIQDTQTGQSSRLLYRIKRLPNPIVRLGRYYHGGTISAPEFRGQRGLQAVIVNMNIDANCHVESYVLYYTRAGQDVVRLVGEGGRFTKTILEIVQQAQPGDLFSFTNLRIRCPGDAVPRPVSGLLIEIQ